ncbi:MAG: Omp28-related outer membrane protein [Tannerella sp.]|nr:Omp28-related outer membrane protein [Tannerella sp.]
MKQTGKRLILLPYVLAALCIWSCSDDDKTAPSPEPEKPVVVKISANKTSIKANGRDSTVFTVTANDVEVVSDVFIIRKKETNGTDTVAGNHFAADEAGTYKFYASYGGVTSAEISIDAIAVVVALQADRETIKANGKDAARFTVTADGLDVTPSAVITLTGAQEAVLDRVSFSAKAPSTYTFYATYDGVKSNEIRIEATELPFLLAADRTSVTADASEKATFTVTLDEEDVTSDAVIFQKYDGTETALDASVFFTENYGTYTFYAAYDGKKSNEVEISAAYVDKQFLMQHVVMDFTSTICPNCPRVESAIREVQKNTPGQAVHRIALHMGGKHCDSNLSGAMGTIANNLSSDVYFPSSKINLKYDEKLTATTTISRISKSIENSVKDRNGASGTGIAIESSVNGTDIHFTVKIKGAETGNYRFFAFIVEDGITYSQQVPDPASETGFTVVRDYVHNDIATCSIGNDPLSGTDLGQVVRGKETVKKFTVRTSEFNTKRTVNLSKCRITAYTIRPNGVIDNVASCPVNGSIHYRYAE